MYDYSKIINDDYWIIENFSTIKVRVSNYKYDDVSGQLNITFFKFMDRFDISPLSYHKSIFADTLPTIFFNSKDEALIELVKIFIKIDFVEKNDLYYSESHDEYFDPIYLNLLIKNTIDEFPDKFV